MTLSITIERYASIPVAAVVGGRHDPVDDDWGDVLATIRFDHESWAADLMAGHW